MVKLKAGIFHVLQIRELMMVPIFDETPREAELSAWQSRKSVFTKVLGNHRSAKYGKEIEKLRFPPSRDTNVSQIALSAITLGLWRFE